jgi:4-oxalmesaconate hydratase
MIIDCHGHYTTAPSPLGEFREAQKAALATDPDHVGEKGVVAIGDDEIRESLEGAQLRFQRERGTDLTLFSPRASWMGHHIGNIHTSRFWTEHCNELIRRVCDLYPQNFAPVGQLPQSPGAAVEPSVRELRRCVDEMGFVGANVNSELDVPAMVHVSAACNPQFHTTGSHYLGADTTAFMQLLTSDVFADFPELRMVIPHGGGAVPYHWGRFRGLAQDMGKPPLQELLLGNVYFDTCVYHQAGIDCLLAVIPAENVLFASEMIGAVRGVDPETGHHFDDTRRYLDAAALSAAERTKIFETNARRVYPRLGGSRHE